MCKYFNLKKECEFHYSNDGIIMVTLHAASHNVFVIPRASIGDSETFLPLVLNITGRRGAASKAFPSVRI